MPVCAVAATDALEELCAHLNARLPGGPFGDEHRLLPLAVRMLEEMPIVALLVQMGWCRPPVEEDREGNRGRKALGRIRLDARLRAGVAPVRRGRGARGPPPSVNTATATNDDDCGMLSVFTFTPTSAYQLFAHEEARRLRTAPGRTSTLNNDDMSAIGAAWRALTPERRSMYEASLRANLQFQNARPLGTCCAYLCRAGSLGLAHCEGCNHSACGHVECFLEQLGKSGIDAAVCDGVLYLCPICLQQRLVAARLEPAPGRLPCGENGEE